MRFAPTAIAGVVQVFSEPAHDSRGSFARSFCAASFAAAGIAFRPEQISVSCNAARHTLRGMHWQAVPHAEAKLVRCLQGTVHDVALDLRAESPTRLRHVAAILDATSGAALFIPAGCAHGFLTLTENAVVEYVIDTAHAPSAARGARWNDPAFGISWPAEPAMMSERDRSWADHAD